MIQMLICRLTSCHRYDKATVVPEDVDRRLDLACLIPMHEVYRLARVLGLARCRHAPVLALIDGLLAHGNARVLHAVLDEDEAGVSATLYDSWAAASTCHAAPATAAEQNWQTTPQDTDSIVR